MKKKEFSFVGWGLHGQGLQVTCTTLRDSLACEFVVRESGGRGWFFLGVVLGCLSVLVSMLCKGTISECHALWWVGVVLVTVWIKYSFIDIVEESLLVVQSLGLQVKVKYASGRETSQFIEQSTIADVIINEAITMHKVVFYLALFVKDQTQRDGNWKNMRLTPLLMAGVPQLETIKPIYHGIRRVLYCEEVADS